MGKKGAEIVLLHPDIPQNTGNIARTCSVTNCSLTLVRPMGFSLTSRHMKRAGLDYWEEVCVRVVDSLEEVIRPPFYFFSSKARRIYSDIAFEDDAMLIFGSETAGFPQKIWEKWIDHFYTIPMKENSRSLNLSNACAIVVYEFLRQNAFEVLNAR